MVKVKNGRDVYEAVIIALNGRFTWQMHVSKHRVKLNAWSLSLDNKVALEEEITKIDNPSEPSTSRVEPPMPDENIRVPNNNIETAEADDERAKVRQPV